jgi:hypothetical protein
MKAISLATLDRPGSMAIYAEEDGAKQATQALLQRVPHRVGLRYQAARFLENIILRPNPLADTRRLWTETRRPPSRNSDGAIIDGLVTMEKAMKRTLIRYKTKPEAADRNAGLIAKVFEELRAAKPNGLRYLSLRLDDDSFVHFVEAEDDTNLITKLEAFQAFQSGIRERCVEPPQARGVTIVGNYRMLDEP